MPGHHILFMDTKLKGRYPLTHWKLGVKCVCLVYTAIIAFPVTYYEFRPGLDPSWIFSMNYQFAQGVGKYLAWTGGPFEFLAFPMAVGANLEIAVIFQVLLWLSFVGLLGYVFFKRRVSVFQVLFFTLLFSLSGTIRVEDVCVYLALLLLCLSVVEKRWYIPYIGFLGCVVLFSFIKFTIAFSLLSGMSIFLLQGLVRKRKKALHATLLGITIIPITFSVSYWLYHPSFSGLFRHIKGTLEIISGYGVAMSRSEQAADMIVILLMFCLYGMMIFALYKARQEAFSISLLCFPFLFVAYKHYFVRHHHQMFQTAVFFGFTLLFTEIRARKTYLLSGLLTGLFIGFYSLGYAFYQSPGVLARQVSGITHFVRKTTDMMHMEQTRHRLQDKQALHSHILPPAWMQQIGRAKVGIFPWELIYAAANDLHYEPFPVFQAYSAYTSYLDRLNADYVSHPDTAPEWILLEWKGLDERHPLADVPLMWLSLYQWYDLEMSEAEIILLKRRTMPRFSQMEALAKGMYAPNEWIAVPQTDVPVIVKVTMDLNSLGRIAKIFSKIPEVRMGIMRDNGTLSHFRITPGTLQDGLLINFLPVDLFELKLFVGRNQISSNVVNFRLFGEGVTFYQDRIAVEFLALPEADVHSHVPVLSALTRMHAETPFHIDSINTHLLTSLDTQTIHVASEEEMLEIRGWAIDADAENIAGGVYVDIDGQLYPTIYGKEREDIARYFDMPAYRYSGFQTSLLTSHLRKGEHELSIKILTHNQTAYYQPSQTIRVHIE